MAHKEKALRKQQNFTFLAAAFALLVSATASAQDPNEIVDVLEAAKAKGKLVACADPFSYPYAQQNMDPPGFDVEIVRELAKRGGMQVEMYWADTSSHGGMSKALRLSMMKGRCDIFTGVSDSGDDDILMGKLAFTDPYIGLGYVLIVENKAKDMKTIDELKAANLKIGVSMSTPIDGYLFDKGIPRELYFGNRRVMEGLAKGEVDAALVWATALPVGKREHPDAIFDMVEGYVPVEGQRWNLKYLVRKRDKSLEKFINEGIRELLDNGKIEEIVESYGVPFYAPFSS
jgi:ABC-type amino acid transport substrate-binding protein